MIKFEKYQSTGSLKIEGTLKEILGEEGTFQFLTKNFNNPEVRLQLLLRKGEETYKLLVSKSLSAKIRAGEVSLAQLAGFPILENEDGLSVLSEPAGVGAEAISLKGVEVEVYQPTSKLVLPASLKPAL